MGLLGISGGFLEEVALHWVLKEANVECFMGIAAF